MHNLRFNPTHLNTSKQRSFVSYYIYLQGTFSASNKSLFEGINHDRFIGQRYWSWNEQAHTTKYTEQQSMFCKGITYINKLILLYLTVFVPRRLLQFINTNVHILCWHLDQVKYIFMSLRISSTTNSWPINLNNEYTAFLGAKYLYKSVRISL